MAKWSETAQPLPHPPFKEISNLIALENITDNWLYFRLKPWSMLTHSNHSSKLILIPTLLTQSAWDFARVSGPGLIPCMTVFPLCMMSLDLHLEMKNVHHFFVTNASRNVSRATIHTPSAQTCFLSGNTYCIQCWVHLASTYFIFTLHVVPMPPTPFCIPHLPIVLVVSPTCLSPYDTSILVIFTHPCPDHSSHVRVHVLTHVVYRCKVVIKDNHLGIRPDSWVQHLTGLPLQVFSNILCEHAITLRQAITLNTYSSALNSYLTFVHLHDLPVKPTPDTLSFYTVFMSHHIKPSLVTSYLSGICQQLEPYFPNVQLSPNSSLVDRTIKGCMHLRGTPTKQKWALTFSDLSLVINDLSHCQTITIFSLRPCFQWVSLPSCDQGNFVSLTTLNLEIGKKY